MPALGGETGGVDVARFLNGGGHIRWNSSIVMAVAGGGVGGEK
jgi:hypothetical protein